MVKDRKYSKPVSKYIINKKDKYIFGSGNEESSMLEGNNHLNFWVHVFVLGGFLYCSMSCRELDRSESGLNVQSSHLMAKWPWTSYWTCLSLFSSFIREPGYLACRFAVTVRWDAECWSPARDSWFLSLLPTAAAGACHSSSAGIPYLTSVSAPGGERPEEETTFPIAWQWCPAQGVARSSLSLGFWFGIPVLLPSLVPGELSLPRGSLPWQPGQAQPLDQ